MGLFCLTFFLQFNCQHEEVERSCASVSHPATVLNLLASAGGWCVVSRGCYLYSIMLPAYHGCHTSLLPIWVPFITVSCLIVDLFQILVGRLSALHYWALRWQWDGSAAAAKSLQSCPTLCDPTDSSPPGSPVPGILQAKTLERVAISFSNELKWKVKVKSLSRVWLFTTPWTAAYQAPPSMGFSRQEWVAIDFSWAGSK